MALASDSGYMAFGAGRMNEVVVASILGKDLINKIVAGNNAKGKRRRWRHPNKGEPFFSSAGKWWQLDFIFKNQQQ